MKLIEAHAKLLTLKQALFQTADAAACLNVSFAHASKILRRLTDAGFLIHLMRSRWAFVGQVDPLQAPEYLTAPYPCYISLQSALYYHGLISQIPATFYAMSPARTRIYQNKLGVFSVHHVNPDFFFGFEYIEKEGIKMATPEKALLDVFYLSPTHSLLFKALPEIEIPDDFKTREARRMIKRIKSERLRTIVTRKFNTLIKNSK